MQTHTRNKKAVNKKQWPSEHIKLCFKQKNNEGREGTESSITVIINTWSYLVVRDSGHYKSKMKE